LISPLLSSLSPSSGCDIYSYKNDYSSSSAFSSSSSSSLDYLTHVNLNTNIILSKGSIYTNTINTNTIDIGITNSSFNALKGYIISTIIEPDATTNSNINIKCNFDVTVYAFNIIPITINSVPFSRVIALNETSRYSYHHHYDYFTYHDHHYNYHHY